MILIEVVIFFLEIDRKRFISSEYNGVLSRNRNPLVQHSTEVSMDFKNVKASVILFLSGH